MSDEEGTREEVVGKEGIEHPLDTQTQDSDRFVGGQAVGEGGILSWNVNRKPQHQQTMWNAQRRSRKRRRRKNKKKKIKKNSIRVGGGGRRGGGKRRRGRAKEMVGVDEGERRSGKRRRRRTACIYRR